MTRRRHVWTNRRITSTRKIVYEKKIIIAQNLKRKKKYVFYGRHLCRKSDSYRRLWKATDGTKLIFLTKMNLIENNLHFLEYYEIFIVLNTDVQVIIDGTIFKSFWSYSRTAAIPRFKFACEHSVCVMEVCDLPTRQDKFDSNNDKSNLKCHLNKVCSLTKNRKIVDIFE